MISIMGDEKIIDIHTRKKTASQTWSIVDRLIRQEGVGEVLGVIRDTLSETEIGNEENTQILTMPFGN